MDTVAVGKRAPDVRLQGSGDQEVRLSDLWSRATSVFVFLRHFG